MRDEALRKAVGEATKTAVETLSRSVVRAGGTFSDLMVALESTVLGVMLVQIEYFGLDASVASALLEGMTHQVMVRLAEQMNLKIAGET